MAGTLGRVAATAAAAVVVGKKMETLYKKEEVQAMTLFMLRFVYYSSDIQSL